MSGAGTKFVKDNDYVELDSVHLEGKIKVGHIYFSDYLMDLTSDDIDRLVETLRNIQKELN